MIDPVLSLQCRAVRMVPLVTFGVPVMTPAEYGSKQNRDETNGRSHKQQYRQKERMKRQITLIEPLTRLRNHHRRKREYQNRTTHLWRAAKSRNIRTPRCQSH